MVFEILGTLKYGWRACLPTQLHFYVKLVNISKNKKINFRCAEVIIPFIKAKIP